jgi:hypothetical protein
MRGYKIMQLSLLIPSPRSIHSLRERELTGQQCGHTALLRERELTGQQWRHTALPEGEGVNGTAVGAYCLFVITMYRQMKKMKKAECPLYSEARSDAPAAAV